MGIENLTKAEKGVIGVGLLATSFFYDISLIDNVQMIAGAYIAYKNGGKEVISNAIDSIKNYQK